MKNTKGRGWDIKISMADGGAPDVCSHMHIVTEAILSGQKTGEAFKVEPGSRRLVLSWELKFRKPDRSDMVRLSKKKK